MAGKKGMKPYPSWMKREAIELYIQEGWSSAEIIEHFGIRDPIRICNWMSQFRKEGEAMFEDKPKGRRPKKENTAAIITPTWFIEGQYRRRDDRSRTKLETTVQAPAGGVFLFFREIIGFIRRLFPPTFSTA